MPTNAVSLASIPSLISITTFKIFVWGYSLQMRWIETRTFATEVIDNQAIWNRPNEGLIRKPMHMLIGQPYLQLRIVSISQSAIKVPARRFGNS